MQALCSLMSICSYSALIFFASEAPYIFSATSNSFCSDVSIFMSYTQWPMLVRIMPPLGYFSSTCPADPWWSATLEVRWGLGAGMVVTTVRTCSLQALWFRFLLLTQQTIVPPAAWMLHLPPSAMSPTICSCADGHSFSYPLLNRISNSPVCSPVFSKGLGPNSYLSFQFLTSALREKSLNMHMWPLSMTFLTNLKSQSLPYWKVSLLQPPQHSQLNTTQSGSTLLIDSIILMATSSLGFPWNAWTRACRQWESQAQTSTLVPSIDFCSTEVKRLSQLPLLQRVTMTATTFFSLSSALSLSSRREDALPLEQKGALLLQQSA